MKRSKSIMILCVILMVILSGCARNDREDKVLVYEPADIRMDQVILLYN